MTPTRFIKTILTVAAISSVATILWLRQRNGANPLGTENSPTLTTTDSGSRPIGILSGDASPAKGDASTGVGGGTGDDPSTDGTANRQLRILNEILKSNNDNDPRMDQDLLILSTAAKESIRQRYSGIPLEKRNQRGTLVFLLGRNLVDATDLHFMEQVLSEDACLSLENCAKGTAQRDPRGEATAGHMAGMDIALAYPQIVALQALDTFLSSPAGRAPGLVKSARDTLDTARRSNVPAIAQMAKDIDAKH